VTSLRFDYSETVRERAAWQASDPPRASYVTSLRPVVAGPLRTPNAFASGSVREQATWRASGKQGRKTPKAQRSTPNVEDYMHHNRLLISE
jgi:hypothetical protein